MSALVLSGPTLAHGVARLLLIQDMVDDLHARMALAEKYVVPPAATLADGWHLLPGAVAERRAS